ncbi:MAG: DnaJ domain-containing protein [Leptolyngbya sp. RL_3_1]|nr:DnaJ domain-containing protein [Leptolyngbya sp. RL_3_1]
MATFYDYYQALGLEPGSSKDAIKKAYRNLAQQWHPDKFANDPAQLSQAQAKFALIKAAYEQLIQLDAFEPEPFMPKVPVHVVSAEEYYQDGIAYAQIGNDTQAIASFTQAIRQQPDHINAYNARAFALEKLGFNLQAEADFAKVAELKQAQKIPTPAAPPPRPTVQRPWTCIQTLTHHKGPVSAVAITPDGNRLITGSHDHTVKIWNAEGRALKTLRDHDRPVCAVAVSGDGKWVASGGVDQAIRIWELRSGKLVQSFQGLFSGHSDTIAALAFHPNSPVLVSASHDRTVRLWDLKSGKAIYTLKDHGEALFALAITQDGKTIAYGGTEPQIYIRHAKTGKLVRSLPISRPPVLSLAFSPLGDRLAIGYGTEIWLWDCDRKKTTAKLKGHSKAVSALAFSADQPVLVSGSHDKTLQRWQAQTGKPLETLTGHRAEVLAIACSADGQMIVSGSADKTTKIWQRR